MKEKKGGKQKVEKNVSVLTVNIIIGDKHLALISGPSKVKLVD